MIVSTNQQPPSTDLLARTRAAGELAIAWRDFRGAIEREAERLAEQDIIVIAADARNHTMVLTLRGEE